MRHRYYKIIATYPGSRHSWMCIQPGETLEEAKKWGREYVQKTLGKGFKLRVEEDVGDQFSVVFRIGMPKSWSEKKKDLMLGKPHRSKPDLDNLIKAIQDILLKDDSGVYEVRAAKYWWHTGGISIINKGE